MLMNPIYLNMQHIVVQAYDPKERLEELKVKRDELTIASVDSINIYSSIIFSTIKNALRFFS